MEKCGHLLIIKFNFQNIGTFWIIFRDKAIQRIYADRTGTIEQKIGTYTSSGNQNGSQQCDSPLKGQSFHSLHFDSPSIS